MRWTTAVLRPDGRALTRAAMALGIALGTAAVWGQARPQAERSAPSGAPVKAPADALRETPETATPGEIADMRKKLADWPQLGRYREANAELKEPAPGEKRVVFFGSSTTDNWGRIKGTEFFPGKPYVNRGIGGQTTAQMVVRFRQDVVELRPAAVVILAGTNDVAGNTGLMTEKMSEENLRSMLEIAEANGIKVILASQLPVVDFPWHRGLHPEARLLELSAFEKKLAAEKGLEYIDYYSVLVGPDGSFKPGLASDGVHPTGAGYALMAPLAERAIEAALTQR